MAGPAGGSCDPSLHRHGLWLLGVLAAPEPGHRHRQSRRLPRRFRPDDGAVHHDLRLEGGRSRLDVHSVLRSARLLGSDLGRLAGARGPAQGGRCGGPVLGRRPVHRRARRLSAPALAALARPGHHRRRRPRPWLYLAGLDADQMVPRPPRHGDRHGHHGLRRRRDDRLAARGHADEPFQDAGFGRRLADLRRARLRLFRLHDGRRLRLSRAAARLASRGLDPADDRQENGPARQRPSRRRAEDPAILADLGRL